MSSDNSTKESFIERVRRQQIIDATIEVLAEKGFVNASFAEIAEKIGGSKSLISYHFDSKEHLLDEVVKQISSKRMVVIDEAIANQPNPLSQIEAMLTSDIYYMTANIHMFQALAEISFHRYTSAGTMQFLSDHELLVYGRLLQLLESAQAAGEISSSLDIPSVGIILDGARDSFLARYIQNNSDTDAFTANLTAILYAIVTTEV